MHNGVASLPCGTVCYERRVLVIAEQRSLRTLGPWGTETLQARSSRCVRIDNLFLDVGHMYNKGDMHVASIGISLKAGKVGRFQ